MTISCNRSSFTNAIGNISFAKAARAILVSVTLLSLILQAPAEEFSATDENGMKKITVKCSLCAKSKEGHGYIRIPAPDHGQDRGSINPKGHWDARIECPLCGGTGRRTVYRLETPLYEALPPCPACGWSGVVKCRKCTATGLVPCKARDCKEGWVVRKIPTSTGRTNKYYKMSVLPCKTCKGLGRVICPECRGMEGVRCRTCSGMGKKAN